MAKKTVKIIYCNYFELPILDLFLKILRATKLHQQLCITWITHLKMAMEIVKI